MFYQQIKYNKDPKRASAYTYNMYYIYLFNLLNLRAYYF